jgi:hypothetical protein
MPDLPVDPAEFLRALEKLRAAVGSTTGTAEIAAAIHRLADEAARMNDHIEQLRPTIESLERHLARSMPVVDSVQGIQQMIRRTMGGRPPGDGPAAGSGTSAPDPQ